MTEPYDAAAELTKLATWIDTTLDNERADRSTSLSRLSPESRKSPGR